MQRFHPRIKAADLGVGSCKPADLFRAQLLVKNRMKTPFIDDVLRKRKLEFFVVWAGEGIGDIMHHFPGVEPSRDCVLKSGGVRAAHEIPAGLISVPVQICCISSFQIRQGIEIRKNISHHKCKFFWKIQLHPAGHKS